MKGLRISLIAEEPLIISNGTTEGMAHKCLDYIPGNMLLGALVRRWKEMHPGEDPDQSAEFCAIFMNGAVSFGHAVPECLDNSAYPTPFCFQYIKGRGSLPSLEESGRGDSQVYNGLQKKDEPKSSEKSSEEPVKWKRLKSPFFDPKTKHVPIVHHVQVMHVAIDAEKRNAEEGRLFGYDAIASGARFCSTIICEDAYYETVQKLWAQNDRIQIGHSRSAGYGTVRIEAIKECSVQQAFHVAAGSHTLYFESAFFPEQSWQTPRDGLLKLLEKSLGEVTLAERNVFSKEVRLEGFNNLWHLPRPSRIGFEAGSVISFTSTQDGNLPATIGKWQQEGYGRIHLDLPLLEEYEVVPETIKIPTQETSFSEDASSFNRAVLQVWRSRTIKRAAVEQALDCVWHSDVFANFFAGLKQGKPSQSQRGNIRRMLFTSPRSTWVSSFSEMLEKQPGKQWKSARTIDPFSVREQRDSLDLIMLTLLDYKKAEQELEKIRLNSGKKRRLNNWELPTLPGQTMTPAEETMFREERHTRLVLEILRRWEKEVRGKEEK